VYYSESMLVLQIITGTVIFFMELLSGNHTPEPVFALFLLFLILVSGGFLSSAVRVRVPPMVFKAAFCCLPAEESPLILLLLPVIGMDLPGILQKKKTPPGVWFLYILVQTLPALFLPRAYLLPFAGLWAAAVFTAFREKSEKTAVGRLKYRLHRLEEELSQCEAARTRAEKTGADQELLIKFQERDRLARLLHNQLGHSMTGSIMQLEAASLLFDEDAQRAGEIIRRVSATLREGLEGVRASLKAVKPDPSLMGEQRIKKILSEFEGAHDLNAELVLQGPTREVPVLLWHINRRESPGSPDEYVKAQLGPPIYLPGRGIKPGVQDRVPGRRCD